MSVYATVRYIVVKDGVRVGRISQSRGWRFDAEAEGYPTCLWNADLGKLIADLNARYGLSVEG